MQDVLPKMEYVSFPSPLITETAKNFGLEAAKRIKMAICKLGYERHLLAIKKEFYLLLFQHTDLNAN